jgi:hypothetical protein
MTLTHESDESSEHNNELHQLHAIANMQDISLAQISHIDQTSYDEDMDLAEELLVWDDLPTDSDHDSRKDSESTTQTEPQTQNHEDNLGNQHPGEDT